MREEYKDNTYMAQLVDKYFSSYPIFQKNCWNELHAANGIVRSYQINRSLRGLLFSINNVDLDFVMILVDKRWCLLGAVTKKSAVVPLASDAYVIINYPYNVLYLDVL